MSEAPVEYARQIGIATIRLNRPGKANALVPELLAGLDRSLEDANRDGEVKVVVLEGAGSTSPAASSTTRRSANRNTTPGWISTG
jgi:enoyl-CoA hydratase/carnithine racemase